MIIFKSTTLPLVCLILASIDLKACDHKQAERAAREYVNSQSPKGSKITLLYDKKKFKYIVSLIDKLGSYSSSGVLTVSMDKKGKCVVEALQSSTTNQNH